MSASHNYYFKFDLTDQSIKRWPELDRQVAHHGAIRVCIVVASQQAWPKSSTLEVASSSFTHWSAIKVPSIEGTEFWMVPSPHQEDLEKKLGFQKKSEPVFDTHENILDAAIFKDPFSKLEIRLQENAQNPAHGISGVQLLQNEEPWSKEKIESAKDTGDLAFEEKR